MLPAGKSASVEQNRPLQDCDTMANNRVLPCHEATKLTPRCLDEVDHDDNGEIP
jgi:hypothetical protein